MPRVEIGLWYGRQKGLKQMVNEERTPLTVASMYGNIDVIRLILSSSDADVNRVCGSDKRTALHCAASGGAVNVIDVVKLLLAADADVNMVDANGHLPADVIVVPPMLGDVKLTLEELLATESSGFDMNSRVSAMANSDSTPLLPLLENGSLSSGSDSPMKSRPNDAPISLASKKKEYLIDSSLPDIKNSIYSTDEFRMYSFKVRPCLRAYSHDWIECPFVHPGENARRRDPRKFHYSCVTCPDFCKGACRRGDMCEYAHGVFECWLHPAQYRTRLCKDGTGCARRVCFFAHMPEELRPLYVSTGSVVLSPRSSTSGATAMDFTAPISLLLGSPSSVSVMSPSPFTPPMSPSMNGISYSNIGWPQPNVPALHLPGSNLQSSRLRSSLNARDIQAEDFNLLPDFDVQQHKLIRSSSFNRSGRMKTLTPSNLDDLFSAERSSPRYSNQAMAAVVFSPTHKSTVLNQFQQQQNMISDINTIFSPKSIEHPLLQASLSALESLALALLPLLVPPVDSWSKWGVSNGNPDWAVNADGLGKHRRSFSFELGGGEPDLSWVQSIVKESHTEIKEEITAPVPGDGSNMTSDPVDNAALGAWLKKMQLDQLVAQSN
ncbi:Zinc finger CCCH domain-containing protein 24 [Hibiscus syriacus]|uniref:Zinc finger CCCH domain-containing protein 24 n=1 Tax=Hibiscus syriacus TaxID=106335 RepID=A0A6A3AFF0_HIBSY|nr:Zinc finger CCCH domain-containing protein 24 [Hibiscus syriacus]